MSPPCHSLLSIAALALCARSAFSQEAGRLIPEPERTVRDCRGGGGRAFRIESAILGQPRRINVALPPSYEKSARERPYPVTVVLDGEANLPATAAVHEELTRHGLVPEAIIVAIENIDPMDGRVHDLTPPGLSVSGSGLNASGDRFLDFIEKELLPAVDRQLRGGPPRILIGHSSGGILATYAAATRSTYRAVISIDAPVSLGQNWLAQKLTARAAAPVAPLRYVSYEARFGWPDDAWATLVAAAPPSWTLYREKLRLEGHETLFMLAAYLGLREVFSDYSRLATMAPPTTSVLPRYAVVSESFGGTLTPPRRLLRDVVEDLLMEGRGAAARKAYTLLVAGYGAPDDSARLLAEIADVERRPPPTETVEGLLATPFPTPDEVRPYIGEWIGGDWRTPEEPRRNNIGLRIRVANGRVIGEINHFDAPPDFAGWRRVDYLRVTPNGLTFGVMNGMRPRGVVMWEGTLKGDTLSGKQRWGGITFTPRFGRLIDPQFSFMRVRR